MSRGRPTFTESNRAIVLISSQERPKSKHISAGADNPALDRRGQRGRPKFRQGSRSRWRDAGCVRTRRRRARPPAALQDDKAFPVVARLDYLHAQPRYLATAASTCHTRLPRSAQIIFVVPTVIVSLLLITHGLISRLLLQRNRVGAPIGSRYGV